MARLTKCVIQAYHKACPLSRPKQKQQPPWWNADLSRLRNAAMQAFKSWKRSRENLWEICKTNLNTFKKEQRKAVRTSWRSFCNNIEGTKETARLRRILSKNKDMPAQLLKPDGKWTDSCTEILSLLISTTFPGQYWAKFRTQHFKCRDGGPQSPRY